MCLQFSNHILSLLRKYIGVCANSDLFRKIMFSLATKQADYIVHFAEDAAGKKTKQKRDFYVKFDRE